MKAFSHQKIMDSKIQMTIYEQIQTASSYGYKLGCGNSKFSKPFKPYL